MLQNQNNSNINLNYLNRIREIENGFYQMNSSNGPYDINLRKNNLSLISKINNSIMIPEHPHPLYSCFTTERSKQVSFWLCDYCSCKYSFSVPSFYCTACDYDMCQKCLFQHPFYKIETYNYGQNEKFLLNNVNKNNKNYKLDIHEHIMALIQLENYNSEKYSIKCKKCRGYIENIESFYYCSLCNYYVCKKCFNDNSYLSADQM